MAKKRTLVTEKRENAGTAAKAGAFWAILAALPFVAKYAAKHRKRSKRRNPFHRIRRK